MPAAPAGNPHYAALCPREDLRRFWFVARPNSSSYFCAHGCFALMATGKGIIQEVCRLACDSTKAKCPIDVLYVKRLQQKGKAHIRNSQRPAAAAARQCPMPTHWNLESASEWCHLPWKAYRHQHHACVWVCSERPRKRSRPAVYRHDTEDSRVGHCRPGAAIEPADELGGAAGYATGEPLAPACPRTGPGQPGGACSHLPRLLCCYGVSPHITTAIDCCHQSSCDDNNQGADEGD
jgi:hypothetical protein